LINSKQTEQNEKEDKVIITELALVFFSAHFLEQKGEKILEIFNR